MPTLCFWLREGVGRYIYLYPMFNRFPRVQIRTFEERKRWWEYKRFVYHSWLVWIIFFLQKRMLYLRRIRAWRNSLLIWIVIKISSCAYRVRSCDSSNWYIHYHIVLEASCYNWLGCGSSATCRIATVNCEFGFYELLVCHRFFWLKSIDWNFAWSEFLVFDAFWMYTWITQF